MKNVWLFPFYLHSTSLFTIFLKGAYDVCISTLHLLKKLSNLKLKEVHIVERSGGGGEVHGSQEKIDDMPVRQLGSHNYIKKSAS